MALYRYVTAKDDLVLLMHEYGIGLPPTIDGSAPWRESTSAWANAQLAAFVAHPWLLDVPVLGIPLTPNGIAWSEAGVTAVAGSGLEGGAARRDPRSQRANALARHVDATQLGNLCI